MRGRGRGVRREQAPGPLCAEMEHFGQWLSSVERVYKQLSDEEMQRTLDTLLSLSPAQVKESVTASHVHVSAPVSPTPPTKQNAVDEALRAVERRFQHLAVETSILPDLPLELAQTILELLSDRDLCACRCVCRSWRYVVDVRSGVWKVRCDALAITLEEEPGRLNETGAFDEDEYEVEMRRWRQAYADLSHSVKLFRSPMPPNHATLRTYPTRELHLPVVNVVQSSSIQLSHGFLIYAEGSGEGKVYSVATRRERRIMPGTEASDFRLYDNRTVMYYSSNRTIRFERFESLANPKERAEAEVQACLKLRRMATCVDCCIQLDLVVVGYESGCLELWSVSKQKRWCVYADHHKYPVYRVVIASLLAKLTKQSDSYRLVSYDPHRVYVWEIAYEVDGPLYHLAANGEHTREEDFAFGLVYKNGCIFHLATEGRRMWLVVTDVATAATIHQVQLHDAGGARTMSAPVTTTDEFRVFCLKDVGRRFALLVVKDGGFYFTLVLDLKTMEGKRLTGLKRCCMEFQGRARGRHSFTGPEVALAPMLTTCDSSWLDGLNRSTMRGVLYAYANHGTMPLVCEYQHECNEIVLVKWNQSVLTAQGHTSKNKPSTSSQS